MPHGSWWAFQWAKGCQLFHLHHCLNIESWCLQHAVIWHLQPLHRRKWEFQNINFSIGGGKIRIRMGNNFKVRIAALNNRGLCDVHIFLAGDEWNERHQCPQSIVHVFLNLLANCIYFRFFYKNSPFYTTYPNECVIGCSLFYPIKKRCIISNVVEVCFYWSDNYLLLVKGFLRNISLELFEFLNWKIT